MITVYGLPIPMRESIKEVPGIQGVLITYSQIKKVVLFKAEQALQAVVAPRMVILRSYGHKLMLRH